MSDQIISAWEPDPREMEKMIDDLRLKIADLKSQRDVLKTIAEEATKAGLAWLDELRESRSQSFILAKELAHSQKLVVSQGEELKAAKESNQFSPLGYSSQDIEVREAVQGIVDALEFYLQAGCKDARREASIKAKTALNAYARAPRDPLFKDVIVNTPTFTTWCAACGTHGHTSGECPEVRKV